MKRLMISAICALTAAGVNAADFFSTENCDNLFTFGARIGVNTTNRTLGSNSMPGAYHNESWGTGFDAGVTVDLNIRDYISIQPGFFFETRSGSYVLMGSPTDISGIPENVEIAQAGKRSSYNFTIPVMAVLHFNLTDNLRWNVELGPYVAFVLDSKLNNKRFIVDGESDTPLFYQQASSVDFGIKMGTGLELFNHYYLGTHYIAGCIDAWKDLKIGSYTKSFGGVTKGWVFTVGYNF
ncbi:MAG: PorT family protein [Muribaculaceae bacterium]|nr:PorT family protein [Muribaculaceae bacterium]